MQKMHERWATRPLKDVVGLQRGHDLPTRLRRAGSVPVVSSSGRSGWHNESISDGPGVVLGRATNLGKPYWVEGPYWPLNTTLYVRDFKGNDPRFVFHLFETLDLTGFDSGSVQPMLNRNFIANVPVRLPPPEEQRRIAGVLGALDDLIDANRRIVDAIARLSRIAFARCSRTARHEVALRSVAVVNEHKTSVGTGAVRYLDIASLGDGVIEWPEPIDWSAAPTRARRLAKAGDTLWSTVRPNRRAHALLADAPDNLVVSTGIAVLTPTAIGPAYLYAATDDQAFVDQLVSRADGSAYPAVRADAFETAAIPLPLADQLRRFEVAMWPLWLAVAELQYEAQTAARTRDELLPLLMSGQVRVEDVAA